jgi:AcrR family transcriptional regulator
VGVARDKLLKAAERLFYADGIAATGIDAVVGEAGVARMSLYNNFGSKDDLVVAYLDRRHAEWLELLAGRLERAGDARGRVLAVFDAYVDHAAFAYDKGFRGCGLLNGAAELAVGHPGRELVRVHKGEVEQILVDLVAKAGVPDAAGVGEHLYLLVEGGVVGAGLDGSSERLIHARRLAERVLAEAS